MAERKGEKENRDFGLFTNRSRITISKYLVKKAGEPSIRNEAQKKRKQIESI